MTKYISLFIIYFFLVFYKTKFHFSERNLMISSKLILISSTGFNISLYRNLSVIVCLIYYSDYLVEKDVDFKIVNEKTDRLFLNLKGSLKKDPNVQKEYNNYMNGLIKEKVDFKHKDFEKHRINSVAIKLYNSVLNHYYNFNIPEAELENLAYHIRLANDLASYETDLKDGEPNLIIMDEQLTIENSKQKILEYMDSGEFKGLPSNVKRYSNGMLKSYLKGIKF